MSDYIRTKTDRVRITEHLDLDAGTRHSTAEVHLMHPSADEVARLQVGSTLGVHAQRETYSGTIDSTHGPDADGRFIITMTDCRATPSIGGDGA